MGADGRSLIPHSGEQDEKGNGVSQACESQRENGMEGDLDQHPGSGPKKRYKECLENGSRPR